MRLRTLLLAALLPIGCDQAGRMTAAVIGDRIAQQAADFQAWQRDGRLRDIADAAVVDCRAEPLACGGLHGLKADACMDRAMRARSDTRAACPPASAEISSLLACAAAEYGAAAPMLGAGARSGALADQSAALYCLAESKSVATGLADARA